MKIVRLASSDAKKIPPPLSVTHTCYIYVVMDVVCFISLQSEHRQTIHTFNVHVKLVHVTKYFL